MSMSCKEVLVKVRELIADEKCWTKQCLALNAFSDPVPPHDPSATCWCLVGAFQHVTSREKISDNQYVQIYEALHHFTPQNNAFIFNDNATHAEVLEMLDKAIDYLTNNKVLANADFLDDENK